MKLSKPSAGAVAEFKAAVAGIRDATPRMMFGYDCIFVNGHFATGVWKSSVVFKLSDEDGARFVATTGAIPFAPMKGRPMKNWWEAPEEVAYDGEQLTQWCARAAAYARAQPPKAAKQTAAKKPDPKKALAKKAPAKKPDPKKPTAKKPAAKNSAARK